MLLEKKDSRPSVSQTSKRPNLILSELIRLFWLASALYLTLALVSYSPTDPSWSTWSSRTEFKNWMGRFGSVLADLMFQGIGYSAFGAVVLMVLCGLRKHSHAKEIKSVTPPSNFLYPTFLVALSFFLQCVLPTAWTSEAMPNAGGVAGGLLRRVAVYATGDAGATLIGSIAFIAATILLFRVYLVTWTIGFVPKILLAIRSLPSLAVGRLKAMRENWRTRRQKNPVPSSISAAAAHLIPHADPQPANSSIPIPLPEREAPKDEEFSKFVASRFSKPSRDVKPKASRGSENFELPSLQLLSGKAESKQKTVDKNWYIEKGNILVQKLKDFGVEGEVVHISPGPVITVYEFKPASGVKIKEIANLSDDLTLALSVLSVRIVAPIPGKPVVGIEIPSPHREMVFFKDMIQETSFYSDDIKIPIALGRLASGEPVVAGLGSMPHLLVAGSTGTGKSVFINTLICSMLYRYTPQQLKLILVDPKMVELSTYEGIPHLMLPVVVDSKKAALALRWAVDEMERRYSLMHKLGVRHVDGYNLKQAEAPEGEELIPDAPKFLPFIVIVIDEYADLMAVVPKDVELSIARLAQKARASGIHLVLATQRPSTDVVTGTIKANFPSRISFRVASSVDSKTILDRTGADRLLGNGDMLFHSAGFSTLKRMQGAYLSDQELERIVDTLKAQGEPEYDESILLAQEAADAEGGSYETGGESNSGQLYDTAVRLVTEKGEASISLIQRHLKIGYNRAASLVEQMEKEGVVAPASGTSKRRAVLVNSI